MRWLGITAGLGLGVMACSTNVIVQEGGGGQGPQLGGLGGLGGAGGVGGAGGAGGEPPTVVPGCEQLVFVGEPVIVPPLSSMIFSREVRAAPLAGGRVGMTWLNYDNTTFMDVLMSNTIEAPFDTWPPAVNPAVQAFSAELISNHPGPIESRVDGTFAVGPGPRGIFAFEHTGPVSPFGDRWAQAFPEPAPSSGVLGVAFDSSSLTYTLESLPDLSGSAPSYVGTFASEWCVTTRAVFDSDSTFFSSGTDYYCEDAPRVDFHRLTSGELVWLSGFDLPFVPIKQELERRPGGGYWYSISNYIDGIAVYMLDDRGSPVGDPWTDSYTYGDTSPMFHPWRDGFVVSKRTVDGISVFVSDGYNITASDAQLVEVKSSNSELAMVTGGANDTSIFFAYPVMQGIELFRADCVTLEP